MFAGRGMLVNSPNPDPRVYARLVNRYKLTWLAFEIHDGDKPTADDKNLDESYFAKIRELCLNVQIAGMGNVYLDGWSRREEATACPDCCEVEAIPAMSLCAELTLNGYVSRLFTNAKRPVTEYFENLIQYQPPGVELACYPLATSNQDDIIGLALRWGVLFVDRPYDTPVRFLPVKVVSLFDLANDRDWPEWKANYGTAFHSAEAVTQVTGLSPLVVRCVDLYLMGAIDKEHFGRVTTPGANVDG